MICRHQESACFEFGIGAIMDDGKVDRHNNKKTQSEFAGITGGLGVPAC